MSPEEAKGWVDILLPVLGLSGLGGVVVAIFGSKKAKHEEPEKVAPTIGSAGMQALGGALIAESQVDRLTGALTAVALAQTAYSEQRRRDASDETRMAEALVSLGHSIVDELRELRRALRHLRPED